MSALQFYSVVLPIVALALVGGLGFVLFRRDVAAFNRSLPRNDASAANSATAEEMLATSLINRPALSAADDVALSVNIAMAPMIERLIKTLEEGSNRSTTAAMANLAEAIQGLVGHMRVEQQMIREWADGQGDQNREIKRLLERIALTREELSRIR
jgi:hypothetical protein